VALFTTKPNFSAGFQGNRAREKIVVEVTS
jgi:hypothetical protein